MYPFRFDRSHQNVCFQCAASHYQTAADASQSQSTLSAIIDQLLLSYRQTCPFLPDRRRRIDQLWARARLLKGMPWKLQRSWFGWLGPRVRRPGDSVRCPRVSPSPRTYFFAMQALTISFRPSFCSHPSAFGKGRLMAGSQPGVGPRPSDNCLQACQRLNRGEVASSCDPAAFSSASASCYRSCGFGAASAPNRRPCCPAQWPQRWGNSRYRIGSTRKCPPSRPPWRTRSALAHTQPWTRRQFCSRRPWTSCSNSTRACRSRPRWAFYRQLYRKSPTSLTSYRTGCPSPDSTSCCCFDSFLFWHASILIIIINCLPFWLSCYEIFTVSPGNSQTSSLLGNLWKWVN